MMIKRLVSFILVLALLCVGLSACGGDDSSVLFMPVEKAAGTLDPQIASDTTSMLIVRNCFEGLVRRSENGEIVPGVALSWDCDDGIVYVFHLSKEAKWHLTTNAQSELEGKLPENFDLGVTADDFVFALRRAISPDTASPEGYMLGCIENATAVLAGTAAPETAGIRALDDYTLEIRLSCPQSNFLEILTEPMCMPCNETFFKACTGRYGRYIKYYLTNGPFYLSRLYEDSYRINKNPDYAGAFAAESDAVWLYVNPDRESVIDKLKNGDYTCAVLSAEEYSRLSPSKKAGVTQIPNVLRSFVFNLNDSVLSDENVRKAINCSLDITSAASAVGQTPAQGFVPLCAADENRSQTHPVGYDEQAAADCFAKGLKALGRDSVEVEILCENEYTSMLKQLIQNWEKVLGVRFGVKLKVCTASEINSAVSSGEYQIALSTVTASADSPYFYFSSYTENSPYRTSDYKNASLPGYIANLCSGGDEAYSAVYHSLEELLLNASFFIPLWNENTYFVSFAPAGRAFILTGADKIYFR